MASSQVISQGLDIVDSIDAVRFDTTHHVFRADYDASRDSVALATVAVVATAEDRDPADLAPLQSAIDTDALESLFAASDDISNGCRLTFEYEGFEVTVFSGGVIEAVPMDAPNPRLDAAAGVEPTIEDASQANTAPEHADD